MEKVNKNDESQKQEYEEKDFDEGEENFQKVKKEQQNNFGENVKDKRIS